MRRSVALGEVLICAETGKKFVAASDGMTFNYAHDDAGNVCSDEGVDLRERRALLDRKAPAFGYLSGDARHFTGWKGNVLGTVVRSHRIRLSRYRFSNIHGTSMLHVTVCDVHGGLWYGRGNPGIAIRLRAYKGV